MLRIRIRICRIHMFFGPPGSASRSTSQRHGSGFGSSSGSFYHQAKIVRKTLIPTVLWLLYDFLPLENDLNVPSKKIPCCHAVLRIRYIVIIRGSVPLTNGSGSGSDTGSCYFPQWPSRLQKKVFQSFFYVYFLKLHLHHFSKIKSHKEVTKQ